MGVILGSFLWRKLTVRFVLACMLYFMYSHSTLCLKFPVLCDCLVLKMLAGGNRKTIFYFSYVWKVMLGFFYFFFYRQQTTWTSRGCWTLPARLLLTWSRERLRRRFERPLTSRMTSLQRRKKRSVGRTSGLLSESCFNKDNFSLSLSCNLAVFNM